MPGAGALVCAWGDSFLRAASMRRGPAPDFVLWFGGLPISKATQEYLADCRAEVHQIRRDSRPCDPDGIVTAPILGDTAETASLLADGIPARSPDPWRERFLRAERAAAGVATRIEIPEADAVALAFAACPPGTAVFLSNSMPVRWAETYATAGPHLRVFAQRGANGIDGITSTAFGVARGLETPLLLVTGDLAFLHDLGGLRLARYARRPVAILLLDNHGGGIFAHLPIAQFPDLDPYFRTPHGCELTAAGALFGLRQIRMDGHLSVPAAVSEALSGDEPRTTILHLETDAAEAADRHEQRQRQIAHAVCSELPPRLD
jgi:2-succinyl-5-enolpyruvyl-6-hydroxy-3-cyclohexene-1-carboxylate synthase